MEEDVRRLMGAIASAIGRDLKIHTFNDRLAIQKGCYILNSWGFGPKYRFNMYVHGPYSTSLASDYYKIGDITFRETNVPESTIRELKGIFDKGLNYAEAYATVLMIKSSNPDATYDRIFKRALELKPHLSKEVEEACSSILNRATSIRAAPCCSWIRTTC